MADLNIPPPPPYSETDIYSNAGGSNPRAPGAYPSSSALTETASIASSVRFTPPYTPHEQSEHGDQFISPSLFYIDSRPVAYRAVGPSYNHEIPISAHSSYEDFPYEASFADRDITTQDWATFLNFLLPHHIDNSNTAVADQKMKAELLDERMQNLTLGSEKGERDMGHVDAQLGLLAPRMDGGEKAVDVQGVVGEWNRHFFEPRGVRIVVHMDHDDPPIVTPDEISEFVNRRDSAGSTEAQAGSSRRPPCAGGRTRSGGDVNTGRTHRHGRPRGGHHGGPRNWDWSDHGPSQHWTRDCGKRGSRHCTGYRMGIPDNNQGCGSAGCRTCGPRQASRAEETPQGRAARNPEFYVPQGGHFKLGRMVADDKGFRIGNVFVATEEGVKIGPMFMGKSPPEPGEDDVEESAGSTVSEESEGSLPDIDDVTPRQLPVLRQSLMDWLNHPDQPVSKVQMKQLKSNLKLTQADKTTFKPEGKELAELKSELKEMKRRFRDAKRERRNKSREMKRQRKHKKRDERRARRQTRFEEKLAAKREAKGKYKATHCSKQAAREAEQSMREAEEISRQAQQHAQETSMRARADGQQFARDAQQQAQSQREQIQHQVRQTVNGFLGFSPPLMGGRGRNNSWTAPQPSQPLQPRSPVPPGVPNFVPAVPPTMPNMPPLPRQPSNQSTHSFHSAHSQNSQHSNADRQVDLDYLRTEAERIRSEAQTLRASADHMRTETQNTAFDEKTRVKLSYDAADLEEEARRMEEEADKCLAEAIRVEEKMEWEKRREEEERQRQGGNGRDYMRRMREGAGVVV